MQKVLKKELNKDEHSAFIKKCETYIGTLKAEHKLVAAQPILREGVILTKSKTGWTEKTISDNEEVQVGYYHINANDLDDAIKMAKENPEFECVPSASIEVRPVKTTEVETGFVYPAK